MMNIYDSNTSTVTYGDNVISFNCGRTRNCIANAIIEARLGKRPIQDIYNELIHEIYCIGAPVQGG